ncbi:MULTISPECIES: phosphatase PAP2 family protein [Enterobacterales]|uniref:acid phosphatase n=1 Tax=Enterobacterales TaxID=91347 RepID=UPI002EDA0B1F
MNHRLAFWVSVLLMSSPVMAKEMSIPGSAEVADRVSQASELPAYVSLEKEVLAALRKSLQGTAPALTRDNLEKSTQSSTQADTAWLKASGYDFQTAALQKQGIQLLSGFSDLPENTLKASLQTVIIINQDATESLRRQALMDAEGISYLWFLSDALGPRLGRAFITAYGKGELSKAAALIKASEVSTGAAKKYFRYGRPFLVQGSGIYLVPDNTVVKDLHPYSADGGSFPSGHTNTGVTDATLLAQMLPERYEALMVRGARYGYSRVVLGVHYPLDIMGSRMVALSNVTHYLNDPNYRRLFNEARDQLRAALEKECGVPLADCARSDAKEDPWHNPEMRDFYRYTLSWDLPKQKGSKNALKVPSGAEVLLESALPHLSAAKRRELLQKTALPAGYPLSGSTPEQQFWQRVDPVAAYVAGKNSH